MGKARSVRSLFDFVTDQDQELPAEQRTTYHLRALPTDVWIDMQELTGKDGKPSFARWQKVALRAGLAGWTGLRDPETGEEVPFVAGAPGRVFDGVLLPQSASDESIDRLHPAAAMAISGAVLQGNSVTKDDLGN